MTADHLAIATIEISAPADAVWAALIDPAAIKQYMFGSTVTSEWQVGSTIVYSGEYEGRPYEDHGRILDLKPGALLRSTHFSPLSGKQDIPENYHTLTWRLAESGGVTTVSLEQDNNESEEAAQHSQKNWEQVLDGLKRVVEHGE
jgi:uncharacterized protein YndB with AHSA1/START domain